MEGDDQLFYDNGTKVPAWFGAKPEGTLTHAAFVCFNGQIYGIRLPETFVYVRLNPLQRFYPMQVYLDISDSCRQFVFVPPVDEWGTEWRMLFRTAKDLKSETSGWLEERMFLLGVEHPCGAAGDVEARAKAKKYAEVRMNVAKARAAQARADALEAIFQENGGEAPRAAQWSLKGAVPTVPIHFDELPEGTSERRVAGRRRPRPVTPEPRPRDKVADAGRAPSSVRGALEHRAAVVDDTDSGGDDDRDYAGWSGAQRMLRAFWSEWGRDTTPREVD